MCGRPSAPTPSSPNGLRAVDLIARKRDGGRLDAAELDWLVAGYADGSVGEGQVAALLMAGVLNGFDVDEARALTRVLVDSGETLDLSGLGGPTVDKHSTGGVGDATTLLVVPLLASAGVRVVKLSGRGLGHTGGTLDKLEAIPGLRVDLAPAELLRIAGEVGCVVAAQTVRLVPADRALYALRDETGTVASPALIASSVMAKKLAAGAEVVQLDVKAGDGAFMSTLEAARELAELCVGIGADAGRRCGALVTSMDQPLGRGIGNALEVAECVELLSAPPAGRLAGVALELAVAALGLARGVGAADHTGAEAVRAELAGRWARGEALETLQRMVAAQGGDPRVCDDPRRRLSRAPVVREVRADDGGWIAAVPARAVGELAGWLGAGRVRKEADVDPAVGIELRCAVGDRLDAGAPVAVVHARDEESAQQAGRRLRAAIELVDHRTAPPPDILARVHAPA